jgi:hypothetical protein
MRRIKKEQFGPAPRISGMGILVITVMVVVLAVVALTYSRWEARAPEIQFDREVRALGKNPALKVAISDAGSGLDQVTIRLKQKENEFTLVDEGLAQVPSRDYDIGKLLAEKASGGRAGHLDRNGQGSRVAASAQRERRGDHAGHHVRHDAPRAGSLLRPALHQSGRLGMRDLSRF